MRNIKSIILLSVFFGLIAITCEKKSTDDPCPPDSTYTLGALNDVSGIVGFDNTNNQFFINKHLTVQLMAFTLYIHAHWQMNIKKLALR